MITSISSRLSLSGAAYRCDAGTAAISQSPFEDSACRRTTYSVPPLCTRTFAPSTACAVSSAVSPYASNASSPKSGVPSSLTT